MSSVRQHHLGVCKAAALPGESLHAVTPSTRTALPAKLPTHLAIAASCLYSAPSRQPTQHCICHPQGETEA